uniref:Olfactory receptor 74 n=1 Tax=Aulacocentrum confusum TaxID=2767324 RepID=A0A7G8Z993_9HYME|nr:olfactory receptor 74 [Aulacocentrum confusum]
MQRREFSQYFWFNKFLLQFCGVLPIFTNNISSFLNILPVILSFLCTSFLNAPAIYSLTMHGSEISKEEIANIFSEHIQLFVAALKVLVLLPKRATLERLVKMCFDQWATIDDDNTYTEISVFAQQAQFITYAFYSNVVCALMAVAVTPIATMMVMTANQSADYNRQLPYEIGFTPDRHFKTIYGLQVLSGFISLTPIVAIDTAVVFFSLHGCAHARSCHNRFKQLTTNKESTTTIVNCIEHHQKVLEFTECVENVFSGVILIQSILSISVICVYSFNLVLVKQFLISLLI